MKELNGYIIKLSKLKGKKRTKEVKIFIDVKDWSGFEQKPEAMIELIKRYL